MVAPAAIAQLVATAEAEAPQPKPALVAVIAAVALVLLKKAHISNVIYVNCQQAVRADVPDVVSVPHHTFSELSLKAKVHLHRARRLVIRRKHIDAVHATARSQRIPDKSAIG